ncbi:MAG: hypothetical protein AB1657_03310 [Candidatus Micrarchaeota archaeon]
MASRKPEPKTRGEPHAPEEKPGRREGEIKTGRREFLRAFSGRHGAGREAAEEPASGRGAMGRREFLGIVAGGVAAAALGRGKKARADESTQTRNAYYRNIPIDNAESVSGIDFRRDYGYMFENRNAQVVQLPETGIITLGSWEIKVVRDLVQNIYNYYVKNDSFSFEFASNEFLFFVGGAKAILLDFPETPYAKGPLLVIASSNNFTVSFYFNKVKGKVTADLVYYDSLGESPPEVGTDVVQNEPYVVVAPRGSIANGDAALGTGFVQYALLASRLGGSGDGPGAGASYLKRTD